MAQPIVMTVETPAQPRQQVLVTGTGFGFVDGAFLVDPDGVNTIAVSYVQVNDGFSCYITVPPNIVTDADYIVELLTLHDEVSSNAAGLLHVDPIGVALPAPEPEPTPDPYPLPEPGESLGIDRLRARTRLELGDLPKSFQATVVGDGRTSRYDLPVRHVDSDTLVVRQIEADDIAQDEVVTLDSDDYTLDAFEGVITLNEFLPVGDVLVVTGTRYRFFDNEQLDMFIQTALAQVGRNRVITTVTVNQYGYRVYTDWPITADTLPEVEILPVSILAKIEALWVLATNAAYDIDISEDGASIPRSERYRQIMGQIQAETARWNELAEQLNIGLGRIEMQTLRRVSRLNNRLVPVYKEREYDDKSLPVRVLPGIDAGAGTGTTFIDRHYQVGP